MKEIKNMEASIKSRLLNISKVRDVDYNALLRHYFQERFLARLASSRFKDSFILKGSFLFLAYKIPGSRLTQDIDFLAYSISNDEAELKNIFREITDLKLDDCVVFDSSKIKSELINESGIYQGFRIFIPCSMGAIKNRIQIDIGYGDKLSKLPIEIDVPVLLPENGNLKLIAYNLETSLAEKFESIVSLGLVNSRMKDFYDLLFFASGFSLNSKELINSIKLTFDQRKTNLIEAENIFSSEFSENEVMQRKWDSFLSSRSLTVKPTFNEVINQLEKFIKPCLIEGNFDAIWNPEKFFWEKQ
jgi:hypothetical protein